MNCVAIRHLALKLCVLLSLTARLTSGDELSAVLIQHVSFVFETHDIGVVQNQYSGNFIFYFLGQELQA